MNKRNIERAKTVKHLAKSIEDSLKEYGEAQKPFAGHMVAREDTRGSIKNRCVVARNELLMIMKELD